jgi:N-acetylglucosamine-6-phosphate deacetylase
VAICGAPVVGDSLAGTILTPDGWVRGRVRYGAAIEAVEPDASAPEDRFILPGFVDLHVHGGHGADVMEGAESVAHMARFHARHGTTALLATTVTGPADALLHAASGVAAVVHRPGSARVLGLHLEGPFVSPDALGAQPPFAIPADPGLVNALAAVVNLRVVTLAPEMDPDFALTAHLRAMGVRVQLGHTTCSYAMALAALQAGASGFTHLFNAMTPLHHRAPGCAGCALAHADHAEMIFDLQHVAAGAVLAARRAIPGLYGVTDAVAAAGMPDGEYRLGTHRIHKSGDTVRLADGTLAGSVLTMDAALRNLLSLGLDLAEAATRLSTIPARYLGLTDRGVIEAGAAADLVMMDAAGGLLAVVAEGCAVADHAVPRR